MHRFDLFLLSAVGVLLTHQVAYALVGLSAQQTVSHGHLEAAWTYVPLALLMGLARSVTKSLQRRRFAGPSVRSLATYVAVGYFGLEMIERLAYGLDAVALVTEPVLWVGLVVACLVAAALHRAVMVATELALAWDSTTRRRWPALATSARPTAAVEVAVTNVHHHSVVSRRGPPVR